MTLGGNYRILLTALALLTISSIAGCNRHSKPVPDFSRRVDNRHDYNIELQEVQIGSTDNSGLPVGNFKPQIGKLPITLSPGKILRLSGSLSVEDGGVAPLSIVVMICPRGKFTLRDSLATSTTNNVYEPAYPAPKSHFELDIRLPRESISGRADIVLYAMAGSWSSIKLLATIHCEIKELSEKPVDDLMETHVVSFD